MKTDLGLGEKAVSKSTDVDPKDVVILRQIIQLHDRATDAFVANQPARALALLINAIQGSNHLAQPEAVPSMLKEKFVPLLYRVGQELAQEHQLDDAILALSEVAEIERRLGDNKSRASVLSDMATIMFQADRPDKALRIYQDEVLPIRIDLEDNRGLRRAHRNIGLAYSRLNEAKECYQHLLWSMERGAGPAETDEINLGLRTVLETARQQRLPIPPQFLERFLALAQRSSFSDLERELMGMNSNDIQPQFRRIKVFFSYAHQDRNVVAEAHEFLTSAAGAFDIFLDQLRLHPGWEWETLLLNYLEEADVFVLFLGRNTLQSVYVRKEIEAYLAAKKDVKDRKLIPVLLPECDEIPAEIASYQCIDIRHEHAGRRLRQLGTVISEAFLAPVSDSQRGLEVRIDSQGELPLESHPGKFLRQKWDAGEINIHPVALRQLVNLGSASHSFTCAHREWDPSQPGEVRPCPVAAKVLCLACGVGACGNAYHLYDRFCTLLPPGNKFEAGTKLFYWCPNCVGPVCARCLSIEDDYPCPPQDVTSYRFKCPSCHNVVAVVPVLEADYEKACGALKDWTRCGGPPRTHQTS